MRVVSTRRGGGGEAVSKVDVSKPVYLGDSVYAETDGYALILTTNNGYPDDPRNRIYLEPDVYAGLVAYAAALRGEKAR